IRGFPCNFAQEDRTHFRSQANADRSRRRRSDAENTQRKLNHRGQGEDLGTGGRPPRPPVELHWGPPPCPQIFSLPQVTLSALYRAINPVLTLCRYTRAKTQHAKTT